MPLRGTVHKRLADVRDEVRRLRETLHVLDEQVAHARDVADDATTRALVASTPLADRQRREAAEELRRTQRMRDDVAQRLQDLRAEQDQLLDRLAPPAGTT